MLFVIESIDGGGKGKQREELVKYFNNKFPNLNISGMEMPFKEGPVYKYIIHDALHSKIKLNKQSWFVAFLLEKVMLLERFQNAKKSKTEHLILDGYYTTTILYQSLLDKVLPLKDAIWFAKYFKIPEADLNFFLDVDVKVALQRKDKEEGHEEGKDIYESDINKQEKLRKGLKRMCKESIFGKWVVINGNNSIIQVRNDLIKEIIKKMKLKI